MGESFMKENIINGIKLFLLMYMMSIGFFMTYSLVWVALGFDLTNFAMLIFIALSLLSEFVYIKWIAG